MFMPEEKIRSMTFPKAEIVEALFGKNIFTKSQSAQIVETLFELIKSLQNGEDVLISGFGKLSVKEKYQRKGENLRREGRLCCRQGR
jgi:integration host factor subunit alpha